MQNKFKGKTMAYPLLGTKIVIDEEKVLREKKYKLDVIYEYLDQLAKQCDLIKIDKILFTQRVMKMTWQIWVCLCVDMR